MGSGSSAGSPSSASGSVKSRVGTAAGRLASSWLWARARGLDGVEGRVSPASLPLRRSGPRVGLGSKVCGVSGGRAGWRSLRAKRSSVGAGAVPRRGLPAPPAHMGVQQTWLSGGRATLAGTVLGAWYPAGWPVPALREEWAAQRGLGRKQEPRPPAWSSTTRVGFRPSPRPSKPLPLSWPLPRLPRAKVSSPLLQLSTGQGQRLGCRGLGPEDLRAWAALGLPVSPASHSHTLALTWALTEGPHQGLVQLNR